MMSDTPRTDRIEDVPMGFMPETSVVEADFARTLERELSESEGVINVWRGRTQRAEAELTRLRAENEALRLALNVASGALLQCEPCMATECSQVQREWLDDARKLIDAALKEQT
jgi:hypothetical protein